MATTVFVRGFDFGTTEKDVSAHCAEAGTVLEVEMWGKGAAVVSYSTPEEAKHAIKLLHHSTIGSNSRYIDVKLNDDSKKRPFSAVTGDSCRVFCRGFDFGTTDEQFEGHMGQVGTITNVAWVTKGAAIVTYSSPEEANYAIEKLNQTIIEGNSRYVDVILKEADGFIDAGGRTKWAKGGDKGGGKGGKKGDAGAWVWLPSTSHIPAAITGGKGGKGKASYSPPKGAGKGKGKGHRDHSDEDPPGAGRVFCRGFDFGTTDDQFLKHMKQAGPIHTVHWATKGSAVVVYNSTAAAAKAAAKLNGTTLPGNSRYMDVILKEN